MNYMQLKFIAYISCKVYIITGRLCNIKKNKKSSCRYRIADRTASQQTI